MPIIVTCPVCGRKGRAAALKTRVRCGECGKEFLAGERGGPLRTFFLGILAFVAIALVVYFAVGRAGRLDAERRAKEAQEELLQKASAPNR